MSFTSLAGVRVLDLGIVTAGASTSAVLADLGAEVIKVEGPSYTDPFREWTGRAGGADWWNASPQFQATNRNKRSVCLELKSEKGREIFMQLVAQCDVVLENFRAGVLARLKIDYPRLCEANPSVILASISSQGQTGPESANSSFGSTLEASSGLASLMRYPGGVPQITGRGLNYPDQVAALFSASSVIAALVERKRTGRGVALDLSQRELTAYLIGEALVAASGGAALEPYDTRPPATVQALCTAQDGQRVAVTAGEKQRLPGADAPVTEAGLEQWIAARPAPQAAQALREAGMAAEVVWTARGFSDPHALVPQDAYARDSQGREVKGTPLRIGGRDAGGFIAAPPLGADNADVAGRLLGLNPAQLRALETAGVFAQGPAKP